MQSKKLNFWKRLYFSITDFRLYPFIIKESFCKAFLYFIKLMLILGAILSVFVTYKILIKVPEMISIYYNEMPEFSITDGTMYSNENVSKKLNKSFSLIVDTDNSFSNINNLLTLNSAIIQENNIIVSSDKVSLMKKTDSGFIELTDIQFSSVPDMNKEQLGKNVEDIVYSKQNQVVLWVIMTVSLFIALSLGSLFNMTIFIFSALIINMIFANKIKFLDYFKIIFYSSTLSSILQVLAMIYLGNISESISFMLVLITTVYLFYALRAVKIDFLISSGVGKTPEERIQNAIETAQKELEKQIEEQMEEIEKKAKDSKITEKAELNRQLIAKKEALDQAQKEYDEILKKVNKKDVFEDLKTEEENATEDTKKDEEEKK